MEMKKKAQKKENSENKNSSLMTKKKIICVLMNFLVRVTLHLTHTCDVVEIGSFF